MIACSSAPFDSAHPFRVQEVVDNMLKLITRVIPGTLALVVLAAPSASQ